MAMMELSITNLSDLDEGRVAAAFALALRNAVKDCVDRPMEKKARTINLQLSIVPQLTRGGSVVECEGVKTTFVITPKFPAMRSAEFPMACTKHGHVRFSVSNPTDPEQSTFDDLGPDGRVTR